MLDIRPLLWKDGWPVGGDNFKEGTYEIQSESSGYALELAVDFVRMAWRGGLADLVRGRGGGPAAMPVVPAPGAALRRCAATRLVLLKSRSNWPASNIDVRLGDFMTRPHQKWTISAVTNAGGFPGSPYFKITIAGTDRALAATADAEVVAVPAFTGTPEQLWRIDQLTDGTYRIMPKVVPNSKEPLALTAVGYSTPTLAKFDPKSDKARWNFKTP